MSKNISELAKDFISAIKLVMPLFIAIIMFQELGENMWRTSGNYHGRRIFYFLAPFLLYLGSLWKYRDWKIDWNKENVAFWLEKVLLVSACYLFWKCARKPKYVNEVKNSIWLSIQIISWVSFGVCAVLLGFSQKLKKDLFSKIILGIIGIHLGASLLVPAGTPAPAIDVFTSNTQAAEYFLDGKNPYLGQYKDIYNGGYDYPPGYAYWPGLLLLQTPSLAALGDIRYALILCHILIIFGLLQLFPKNPLGRLFVLLWCALPIHFFIIEQSWIDPILVACFVFSALFIKKEKIEIAGLFLGYACATKQYSGVVAILLGFHVWKTWGFKSAIKLTAFSLIPFFAVMGPFWIWDFKAWKKMTMDVPLGQDMRLDSFSLVAYFANKLKWEVTKSYFTIPPLIAMVGAIALNWFKSISVNHLTFGFLVILFLFGKQAFANYYYFASIFLLIGMEEALSQRPLGQ